MMIPNIQRRMTNGFIFQMLIGASLILATSCQKSKDTSIPNPEEPLKNTYSKEFRLSDAATGVSAKVIISSEDKSVVETFEESKTLTLQVLRASNDKTDLAIKPEGESIAAITAKDQTSQGDNSEVAVLKGNYDITIVPDQEDDDVMIGVKIELKKDRQNENRIQPNAPIPPGYNLYAFGKDGFGMLVHNQDAFPIKAGIGWSGSLLSCDGNGGCVFTKRWFQNHLMYTTTFNSPGQETNATITPFIKLTDLGYNMYTVTFGTNPPNNKVRNWQSRVLVPYGGNYDNVRIYIVKWRNGKFEWVLFH